MKIHGLGAHAGPGGLFAPQQRFGDSKGLVRNSGLLASVLIEVGDDHRLADPEPLEAMLQACERAVSADRK